MVSPTLSCGKEVEVTPKMFVLIKVPEPLLGGLGG
jgi:hypothetical protein